MKTIFSFFRRTMPYNKILLGALLVVVFVPEAQVFAATSDEFLQNISGLMNMVLRVVNALLLPALLLMGDLLDTDLILGGKMEERMLNLWSLVRNLVNVVFAVFLMGVAVYNVLGLGEDEGNFAIKTALPRLIIGLIIVNFTFPIGKIAIDVVNVATQVSFNLVGTEIKDSNSMSTVQEKFATNACKTLEVKQEATPTTPAAAPADAAAAPAPTAETPKEEPKYVPISKEIYEKDSLAKTFCALDEKGNPTGELKEWLLADYLSEVNSNNIGLVMAVNMQNLMDLHQVDGNRVKTWGDLTTNLIFNVVVYIVLVFSYLALAWVLLTRVFVLWGALILSPLAVLFYVIPEIKEWLGLGDEMTSKVIKHLVAPVVIGLTLSLGFILMDTWQNNTTSSSASLANVSVESIVSSGMTNYTDFLVLMGSVVVLWMGVFSASSGTFAESVTNQMKEFGETAGSWVARQPLNLPVIPLANTDDGKEARSLSLRGIISGSRNMMEATRYDSSAELRSEDFSRFGLRGVTDQSYDTAIKNLKTTVTKVKNTGGSSLPKEEYDKLVNHLISVIKASSLDTAQKSAAVAKVEGVKDATQVRDLYTLVVNNDAIKGAVIEATDGEAIVTDFGNLQSKSIAEARPQP